MHQDRTSAEDLTGDSRSNLQHYRFPGLKRFSVSVGVILGSLGELREGAQVMGATILSALIYRWSKGIRHACGRAANLVMEPLTSDDPVEIGGYQLHARLGAGGMG